MLYMPAAWTCTSWSVQNYRVSQYEFRVKYTVHMLKSYDLNRFNFICTCIYWHPPSPINRLIEQKQILSQSTADQ